VPNRGNRRAEVYHESHDDPAFMRRFAPAAARLPLRVPGSCRMPDPFPWYGSPTGTAT
jgi:hypothetical protein